MPVGSQSRRRKESASEERLNEMTYGAVHKVVVLLLYAQLIGHGKITERPKHAHGGIEKRTGIVVSRIPSSVAQNVSDSDVLSCPLV